MVGWHHQLNAHGFGWTPGVGEGKGSLASWGPWGRIESDRLEGLNRQSCLLSPSSGEIWEVHQPSSDKPQGEARFGRMDAFQCFWDKISDSLQVTRAQVLQMHSSYLFGGLPNSII